jgi:SnoaL-like domain
VDMDGRLAAIEARLEIAQLPVRYALGVDSRDVELIVGTFHPEAWMGKRWGLGPDAARAFYNDVLKRFYRSVHHVGGHLVELIDADNATGKVYCRAEHEDRGKWIVQSIIYSDEYKRAPDGWWCFLRRRHLHWYSTDILDRPAADFQSWPGWENDPPALPHAFPSWTEYWGRVPPEEITELTSSP